MTAAASISVRAARHRGHVRYHVWATIWGHQLAEARTCLTRRRAAILAAEWLTELNSLTDEELLQLLKADGQ